MISVLLIDDDPMEAKLTDAFLRLRYEEGYHLEVARGAEEAVRALQRQAFDRVLLDNRLPPFGDFREVVLILRPYLRGERPIVISTSLAAPCFAEWTEHGVAFVMDKGTLRDRIGQGLLDRPSRPRRPVPLPDTAATAVG